MRSENKKAVAVEELIWWIIAIAILVIIIIGNTYLKSKGISAIDYIKNFFKFR